MSKIAHNVTLLFVAQAVGYLIPVFEIPVLARSLGPESYGKLVMVQALALLASLCVEYGFGISAARQVALVRDDSNKISEIYGQVLSAKLMVSGVLLTVLVLGLTQYEHVLHEMHLVVFGVLYFLAFGLSPIWLFQGLEQLFMVTLVDVLLRCSGLLLLLGFVNGQEDYHLAMGIMASVGVLNTLAGCCLCIKWVNRLPLSYSGGLAQIKSGFHVFIYKGAGNILMSAGAPLVSMFSSVQVLAYYVAAEKIVRSLAGLATPVLTAVFPFLSRLGVSNRQTAVCTCLVMTAVLFIGGVVLAVALVMVGGKVLALLLGHEFEGAAELLNIFVWLIPFRLANQSMGLAGLIVIGKQKLLARLTLMSSLCAVIYSAGLAAMYGAAGVIIGFVLAEAMLFVSLIYVVLKTWLATWPNNINQPS